MYTVTTPHTTPQPFYGPFSGTTRVSRCLKRTSALNFMVQEEINTGRHNEHPAGCHSIWTNQCPPPPSPIFSMGRMPFLPPNQQCKAQKAKALKAKICTLLNYSKLEMWANAQRDGRPAEYRWRLLLNAAVWLTPTTRVPCSNAA